MSSPSNPLLFLAAMAMQPGDAYPYIGRGPHARRRGQSGKRQRVANPNKKAKRKQAAKAKRKNR